MPDFILRYGSLRLLGRFTASRSATFRRGQRVLAKTRRGVEMAEVLCEASEGSAEDLQDENGGRILREYTDKDREQLDQLHQTERQCWDFCQSQIAKLKLEMQLIDVEKVFFTYITFK